MSNDIYGPLHTQESPNQADDTAEDDEEFLQDSSQLINDHLSP
jgi:hypothetical protein